MKRLLFSVVFSIFFLFTSAAVFSEVYGGNASERITPLSPGMWISDYLVPMYGECTSKELPYDQDLADFYFFATNLYMYTIVVYGLTRLHDRRKGSLL